VPRKGIAVTGGPITQRHLYRFLELAAAHLKKYVGVQVDAMSMSTPQPNEATGPGGVGTSEPEKAVRTSRSKSSRALRTLRASGWVEEDDEEPS
jgi:hypothetical protein